MASPQISWYLMYCKAKEEQRAVDNLRHQGIEGYFPTMPVEKIQRGKRIQVDAPLFPNYLFVKLDEARDNFNSVRSTRGIVDFVKFGIKYTRVPTSLVKELQNRADDLCEQECPHLVPFNSGDRVFIESGPFKGVDAIYQCQDGLERSVLLLTLLNQENEVSIANQDFVA